MTRADGHLAQEDPAFRVEGAFFDGCAGQSPGVRDVLGFEGVPGGQEISLEGNLGQGQRTLRSGEACLLFHPGSAAGHQLPGKTGGGLRGVFPGPMGSHMLCALLGPLPPLRRLLHGFAEGQAQGLRIRAQPPAPMVQLPAAHFVADKFSSGRDAMDELIGGEVVGGTTAGANYGQRAGHRFEHREPEALAAVRVNEAVAGGVKPGQFALGQLLIEIHDLRRCRVGLSRLDLLGQGLTLVGRFAAEVFDHQAHVVGATEGFQISLQQQVRPLASDGSADKEEPEALARGDGGGGGPGMMNRGIVAVGQHPEFFPRDTRLQVQTPDVAAGAPDLIHSLRLLCPLGGDGSELPRLDEHPGAVLRATPVRRPGVTQGDRGVRGRAPLNSLGPTLEIRGDELGGRCVRRDSDGPEPGLLVEPLDQGAVHMR